MLRPAHYVDLSAVDKPQAAGASPAKASSGSVLAAASRLMGVLHGIFRNVPGSYAVALPQLRTGAHRHPGAVVRVFAETREGLESLLDNLEEHHVARDYFHVGRVRQVPADYAGAWVSYQRFRVPGRGSRLGQARASRLDRAEEVPYFMLTSASNRNSFSLHVTRVPGEACDSAEPDSYGLAVASRPFALPDIPAR